MSNQPLGRGFRSRAAHPAKNNSNTTRAYFHDFWVVPLTSTQVVVQLMGLPFSCFWDGQSWQNFGLNC